MRFGNTLLFIALSVLAFRWFQFFYPFRLDFKITIILLDPEFYDHSNQVIRYWFVNWELY